MLSENTFHVQNKHIGLFPALAKRSSDDYTTSTKPNLKELRKSYLSYRK